MDMRNYPQDILRFIHVFEEARRDNWGCVPLTEKEILATAAEMKAVIDPEIIVLAEVGGQPAGAVLAIPNFNPAPPRRRRPPAAFRIPPLPPAVAAGR